MILKNFLLNDLSGLAETTTKSFFEVPKTINDVYFDNLRMLMDGTNLTTLYRDNSYAVEADNNIVTPSFQDDFLIDYAKEKVKTLNLESEVRDLENELISSKIKMLELVKHNERMQTKEKILDTKLEKEKLINNNLSTQFGILECELQSVKKEWNRIEQAMMENESNLRKRLKEVSENNSGLNIEIENLKDDLSKSENILENNSTPAKAKKINKANTDSALSSGKKTVKKKAIKEKSEKELVTAEASVSRSSASKSSVAKSGKSGSIRSVSTNNDIVADSASIVSDAFSKLNNVTVLPLREDSQK